MVEIQNMMFKKTFSIASAIDLGVEDELRQYVFHNTDDKIFVEVYDSIIFGLEIEILAGVNLMCKTDKD